MSETPLPQPWLSVRVLEAAIAERSKGEQKCITVEDLEGNLGAAAPQQAQPMRAGPTTVAGSKGFAARSTGGIAARVNKLCSGGNESTIAVA